MFNIVFWTIVGIILFIWVVNSCSHYLRRRRMYNRRMRMEGYLINPSNDLNQYRPVIVDNDPHFVSREHRRVEIIRPD